MDWLIPHDWTTLFVPDTPLLEIFLRGTIMYLGLFALLRVVFKRGLAEIGMTDLLVVVLIADAAQNAMAGGYESIPDGLLLVAVIMFWAFALDWLSFRFPVVDRIIKPHKLLLVRDGEVLWDNLAKELLTEEELWTQLRANGVGKLDEVRYAFMEPDGRVTVVSQRGAQRRGDGKKRL